MGPDYFTPSRGVLGALGTLIYGLYNAGAKRMQGVELPTSVEIHPLRVAIAAFAWPSQPFAYDE